MNRQNYRLSVVGENNPFYGKKHTLESRLRIANAGIGRKQSKVTKLKRSFSLKKAYQEGRHTKRIGIPPSNRWGNGHIPWNKGLTKETSSILKRCAERPRRIETLQKMRDAVKGSKSWNWQGGKTPLHEFIRHSLEFKKWREDVFKKDGWICQQCFTKGKNLHPHHRKSFSKILENFLKEYSQFSPIDDKETLTRLAISYEPFWDVRNGKTLCEDCHKEIHKLWRKNALANSN